MNQYNDFLFSIVVTVYNKESVLDRCVTSLLNQTNKNIQIILVNDGSKDSSLQMCYEYAKKDSRIKVIDQKNTGVAGARNTGLLAADGQYVTFIDSDDYLEANIFENVANFLSSNEPVDMVSWGCIEEDIDSNILAKIAMEEAVYPNKKKAYLEINSRLLGYVWLWAFKKDMLWNNNLLFDKFFEPIDDYLFVLNAFDKATSIGAVKNTFYHYVRSNSLQSLSKTIPPHVFNQHLRISMFKLELFKRMGMDETYIAREMKLAMYATLKNGIKRLFRHDEENIIYKIQQMIETPEMQSFFYDNPVEINLKESELQRYQAVLHKNYQDIYILFREYEMKKRQQSGEHFYFFPNNITDKNLAYSVLTGKTEVAIYGSYPFGDGYVDELIRRNIKVSALFDASEGNDNTLRMVCNIPVSNERSLRDFNGVLIIAGNGSYQKLSQKAAEYGIKKQLPYYFIYDRCSFNFADYRNKYQIANVAKSHMIQTQFPETTIIHSLELAITHRCTLNCEKCANLISYFECPEDACFDEMRSSIEKILNSNVYVTELRVLGGEPFLNKELPKYLHLLQSYKNIGLVSIMTNATIIPTSEEISLLKDQRVYVTISNYGALSKKFSELVDLFENEGVLYRVYDAAEWQDCNTINFIPLAQEDLRVRMKNCSVNNCYTLYNNNLYRCPYNAGVTILHAVPQDITDYLDINQIPAEELNNKLKEFMETEISSICAYCKGRPRFADSIEAAKQMKGKHPYQKYVYEEK